MRKAIIIDDRLFRQENLLGDEKYKLENIPGLTLSYHIEEDYAKYLEYDLIAIHRSALAEANDLYKFIKFCKDKGKYLVTFSGGVPKDSYYSDNFIELNSRTFYNIGRLIDFFTDFCGKDDEVHLLRLIYGENWKLPYLVEYNHLKWQFGKSLPPKFQDRLYDMEDIIGDDLANDANKRNQEIENLKFHI